MSEREIKAGSTWRNVHGEVTVKSVDSERRVYSDDLKTSGDWMVKSDFLATHEWVRDPVELPKYVRRDFGKCPPLWVYGSPKRTTEGHIEVSGLGFSHVYTDSAFNTYWEPCDPPPLVKALDELDECVSRWRGNLSKETESVITEWRRIKESIK